ncbi:MAG: hypothetical protein H7A09_06865 [Oceanospirillaceae bacterium]|nr:hypothetical protein [Oceanospirillaceae bacterium]MCP5349924.1 hypothetical protein [Oceanospirillaceae bacterium]
MAEKSAGTASPMPIQGSGCGIRPTPEALEVNYGVDFSAAAELLNSSETAEISATATPKENKT